MVTGLAVFREHFRAVAESFVVIGGVACDEWFGIQGLPFRATKDVDIVLLLEAKDWRFAARFWEFVRGGRYAIRQRSTGERICYRFQQPGTQGYPETVELFSRSPAGIEVARDQEVVPVPVWGDLSSLSAILMDDAYYELVRANCEIHDGLPLPRREILIALKAAAWLDLGRRRAGGEEVDSRHVKKHRNDVFRLAHILPAGGSFWLPAQASRNLRAFLDARPAGDSSWGAITSAIATSIPAAAIMRPDVLLTFLESYFVLA